MFYYIQNIFQFYLPFIKCNLPGTEYTGYLKDAEINGLYPKKQNVSFSVFNLFPNTVTQMKIFNNLKAIKGRETGCDTQSKIQESFTRCSHFPAPGEG